MFHFKALLEVGNETVFRLSYLNTDIGIVHISIGVLCNAFIVSLVGIDQYCLTFINLNSLLSTE